MDEDFLDLWIRRYLGFEALNSMHLIVIQIGDEGIIGVHFKPVVNKRRNLESIMLTH